MPARPVTAPSPSRRPAPWSYTAVGGAGLRILTDLWRLVQRNRGDQAEDAARTVHTVKETAARVLEVAGLSLRGRKILEIGPGQLLRHARCFAVDNDVTCCDTDAVPRSLRDWLLMLRDSPWSRTVKTFGRKVIGKDRRFAAALTRELGVAAPWPRVLRMTATRLQLADESFDMVCSYSVLEHVDDPAAALREAVRVLRPGGVAYLSVHIYTCHSGAHDLRIMGAPPAPPYWPHLRPGHAGSVRPSAYLNRLSCAEWVELFREIMPGARLFGERDDPALVDALGELRQAGELSGYSDEELLTVNLVAVWAKPSDRRSRVNR